jgi:hypothetical protein
MPLAGYYIFKMTVKQTNEQRANKTLINGQNKISEEIKEKPKTQNKTVQKETSNN